MSYCWFTREKLLKNAWDKYHIKGGKLKATKCYAANQQVLREDARNKYRNWPEKENNRKMKYQRERYHMNIDLNDKLKQYQRSYYASKKIEIPVCFYSKKMSEQTIKRGNAVVNEK